MNASWMIRAMAFLVLLAAGLEGVRPMVSYRALELGGTTGQIGILAASYGALAFFVAIPAGQWIGRFGEIQFLIGGTALMAAPCWALFFAGSLPSLGAAQALLGGGHVLSLVALQTLVANCGPPDGRDGRFGMLAIAGSVGQITGPLLAGLVVTISPGSSRQVFVISSVVVLAAVALAVSLLLAPPPMSEQAQRGESRRGATLPAMVKVLRIRSMPQAMLASLTVLSTIDILVAYVPVYGERVGLPVATVTMLLSVRAGASTLARIAMVPLIRWTGRRRLLVASMTVASFSMLAIPLVTLVWLLVTLMVAAGFGLGLGQPMSVAWVAGAAPASFRGIALGVRLTGNRLGQVALPAAVGAVGRGSTVEVGG